MKKIIILDLSPERLTAAYVSHLKEQALVQFANIVSRISVTRKTGEKVTIRVRIDDLNPAAKHFYNAYAEPSGVDEYTIYIGGGLLARLDVLAQAIAADSSVLRASTKSKLISKDGRRDGRRKVIANFAFHYLLDLIFWHEFSHVILGHNDWLAKRTGAAQFAEFFVTDMTAEKAADRRALEADADRQATLWAAALFDYTLQTNLHLRYSSVADAFYDFGYLSASLFLLFDALDKGGDPALRVHPTNHQRICTFLVFIDQYLERQRNDVRTVLTLQTTRGALEAVNDVLHINKQTMNVLDGIRFVAENGKELERLQIRQHQLIATNSQTSSFHLAELYTV